jgi:hypothetical protein
MALTQAEARMKTAAAWLELEVYLPPIVTAQGDTATADLLRAERKEVATWLRRRALAADKIAIRQTEKPLGRQVGMTAKQARRRGIPLPKEKP